MTGYRYGYYDPTEKRKCLECNGSGAVMVWDGHEGEGVPDPCPNCNGTGEVEQGHPSSDYD